MGQGRAGRGMQSGAERREGRMGRQVSSLSRWAVEQKLAGPPGGGNRQARGAGFQAGLDPSRSRGDRGILKSGGHGIRTHNRFPGTTFPVWPLTIRLPSKRMFFCLGTPLGTPQTGLARLRRTTPRAQITARVYPSAFSPQRPSLPAVFSGFSGSWYPQGAQECGGGARVSSCAKGTLATGD